MAYVRQIKAYFIRKKIEKDVFRSLPIFSVFTWTQEGGLYKSDFLALNVQYEKVSLPRLLAGCMMQKICEVLDVDVMSAVLTCALVLCISDWTCSVNDFHFLIGKLVTCQVNISTFALLFSEMVQYCQNRVNTVPELQAKYVQLILRTLSGSVWFFSP